MTHAAGFPGFRPARDALATATLSRRALLRVSAAAGGGLLLGIGLPAPGRAAPADTPAGEFAPDAYIRLDTAGNLTLIMPQVEMGQGIYTALAALIAEEMDADFSRIAIEAAPPDEKLYANPLFHMQVTGGSTSVRAFWLPMRQAGAAARAMLVAAAAAQWGVPPESLSVANSVVSHPPSHRGIGFGALATAASALAPPAHPTLKTPAEFTLIGKPLKRLDTPPKVTGAARFGIDAMPSEVAFATLASCPVFGGKVASVGRQDVASAIDGVTQIVVLDDLVAVIGKHGWAAIQGLRALDIVWDEGDNADVTTQSVLDGLIAAAAKPGVVARNDGDADKILAQDGAIDVEYQVPFLAHATMEPMNCTVQVSADACEVWVGNQVLARAQQAAAAVTGLPLEKVTVHNHLLGGGFGRRLEIDMIVKAVRIAQKVPGPVKIVWTREEDIQNSLYRPFYFDRLSASLKNGAISAWRHRITGSSVIARWAPGAMVNGLDPDAVDGAVDFPYAAPNVRVEFVRHEPKGVPTCFWRSVGPGHNIFVVESFVDELAHKAGQDPVRFRRAQLGHAPRLAACLDRVAQEFGWGATLPPRTGHGVALEPAFGSFLAAMAEVAVDDQGIITLKRIVCAVDCGMVVNPDTVAAQIQGGLIFGLTAALWGQITLQDGRVQQSNFNNYRMLRINEAPDIKVIVMPSAEPPGGIGEPGTAIAAPVLANAIFAATGVRLRALPIDQTSLAKGTPA